MDPPVGDFSENRDSAVGFFLAKNAAWRYENDATPAWP
jgi:hypothetical protein